MQCCLSSSCRAFFLREHQIGKFPLNPYYFDPETGKPLRGVTHQGYSADSVWARGQAWGVYGLALSYRYTRSPEYLEDFKHVTDYFLTHLPENLVPYWDFIFEDGSGEPWDSSASAIVERGRGETAPFPVRERFP